MKDDFAIGVANGNGGSVCAAHHHAFNDSLAAVIELDFAGDLFLDDFFFHLWVPIQIPAVFGRLLSER